MGIFNTFFNPRKPRGFEYVPRYYDKEKEQREERKARIIQEVKKEKGIEISDDEYVPNIRGQFRARKENRSKFKHRQNVRIIMVFFVLLYLAYLLYEHL